MLIRKVQARTTSVVCEGKEPAGSHSAMRAVRRLTQLRCWVVPGRDSSSSASSVRRVPSLLSAVEFNLVAIPPGLCREESRQKPSGRPGHGRPGRWRRQCQSSFQGIKTFGLAALPRCQPQTAPVPPHQRCRDSASIRLSVPVREDRCTPHHRHLALTPLGRPGPGHGGRLPTHNVGLFRCSREPKVSLPRRSRARRPHTCQTASRATLQSLRSFRALWHWKTQSRVHASKRVCKPATSPAQTVPPLRLPAP